jgi:hypothetical protein
LSILEIVVVVLHRLSALALSLALLAGNLAVCAGWTATPEARMACCAGDDRCPMHKHGSHTFSETGGVSQAQADACCGAAERQQSSHSAPSFVTFISSAVLGAGVVVPVTVPALVATDVWRAVVPIPVAPIPRHVLFSVFIV